MDVTPIYLKKTISPFKNTLPLTLFEKNPCPGKELTERTPYAMFDTRMILTNYVSGMDILSANVSFLSLII